MTARKILTEMITSNWGPYKDYSPESIQDCMSRLKFTCDEILASILPEDQSPYDSTDAEYYGEFDHNGSITTSRLFVWLTFFDKSTMAAEDIAKRFSEIVDVPVEIIVREQTSRFASG